MKIAFASQIGRPARVLRRVRQLPHSARGAVRFQECTRSIQDNRAAAGMRGPPRRVVRRFAIVEGEATREGGPRGISPTGRPAVSHPWGDPCTASRRVTAGF